MKHLLVFAVILSFLAIVLVVRRLKSDTSTTISLNAAKDPVAFFAIAIGVTVSLALATIYYAGWLQPAYNLTIVSTFLFFGIILSFALTSWIPDSSGWKRRLHRLAAYLAIFIMPAFLVSLLAISTSSFLVSAIILGASAQLFMLYLLFFVPKARQWFLLFQVLYLTVFFVILILLTYGVS